MPTLPGTFTGLLKSRLGLFGSQVVHPSNHAAALPTASSTVILVRWRKRRTQPQAPSKLYNVRRPTYRSPDEREMLSTGLQHYRTQVKSILAFLKSQKAPIVKASKVKEKRLFDANRYDEELNSCLEINDKWNSEIADQRTSRLAAERSSRQQHLEKLATVKLQELEAKQKVALAVLHEGKERFEKRFDMSDLDTALDKFLDSEPLHKQFALKPNGEKVKERIEAKQ